MGKLIHRVGTEAVPKFGGVRRECDPGAIPPHMLRDGINIRLKDAPGAPIVSRGGQSLYGGAMVGCVRGIFPPEYQFDDLQPCGTCTEVWESGLGVIEGEQLYEVGLANLGPDKAATFTPGSVYNYFSDGQTPKMRLYRNTDLYDPDNPNVNLNMIVFSDDGVLAYMAGVDWNPAGEAVRIVLRSFNRGALPVEVAAIAAPFTDAFPCSIAVLGSDIFLTVAKNAGTGSLIYKVSGSTFVVDDAPATGIPLLRKMGSDLYAVYSFDPTFATTFAGKIRRRVAGTWSDLSLPGAITKFSATAHPTVFSAALYCPGAGAGGVFDPARLILKVVGSTVTTELEEGSTSTHLSTFQAVFDSKLYYVFLDESDVLSIGQFNGAAWDNFFKVLSGVDPNVIGFAVAGGSLRLLTLDATPAACRKVLYSSPGTVVSGTWVKEEVHHKTFDGSPPGASFIVPSLLETLTVVT